MARISGAQATYKTLDIISELALHPTGASVGVLSRRLGFPQSTVHRFLSVLVDRRFANHDPVTHRYSVGPQLTILASRASIGTQLVAVARPALEDLASSLRETVFLSILDGYEILYLDCVLSTRSVQMWGAPGMRVPIHVSAQGKAIVAFLPEHERERILNELCFSPTTPRTNTDRESFRRELERVRSDGFAQNNEEQEEGVRSVAAPVLDRNGYSVATICVGAPGFRATMEHLRRESAPLVVAAAREISQSLAIGQGFPGDELHGVEQ